jgi:hypothetical protein
VLLSESHNSQMEMLVKFAVTELPVTALVWMNLCVLLGSIDCDGSPRCSGCVKQARSFR